MDFFLDDDLTIDDESPHDTSSNPSTDNTPDQFTQKPSRTLAPNLTRKSHKKSRAGCYTCKGRKIKCGEEKPKCQNCRMKNLLCTYPSERPPQKRQLTLAKRAPSLSSTVSNFTITDMRFFHHFLTLAYPHLPIGNDHVWVQQIPTFAEQHEYLMHAILALGASHLARLTGTDYSQHATIHRGHAIAGLNKALSKPAQKFGEADALLAACYCLTFESSYDGQGLESFITMVRGCALATSKIRREKSPTAFILVKDWHYEIMKHRLHRLPRVDVGLLAQGIESLLSVAPLLQNRSELDFHSALLKTMTGLRQSPSMGYLSFITIFSVWQELNNDQFQSFINPNNLPNQLLLAYFVALQMIMIPISVYEWPSRAEVANAALVYGAIEWAEGIFERLKFTHFDIYLDWPKQVILIVRSELTKQRPYSSPEVLQLDLSIEQDDTPLILPQISSSI